MNEQMLGSNLRRAVDARLSGVTGDPHLARRVLARAKGETKMKRKLSTGLAVAILLILLSAAALAIALLSAREIIDQAAIPMASETEGNQYSVEQTRALLALAEENGLTLTENARIQLRNSIELGEGAYKDEMLRTLAKAEFGEDPSTWTLAQQQWLDEVFVALGLFPEPHVAMPEGGEDAKNPIIAAAFDHIRKTYTPEAKLEDSTKFRVGVQYINGDVDGEYPGMYWSIDITPLTLEGAEYWVYLRDDGSVIGDVFRPGLTEQATITDIHFLYERIYGAEYTWSHEILQSFGEDAANASDTNHKVTLCFQRTTYPDIPEGAITREAAHALAESRFGADENIMGIQAFLIGDSPNPVWKVRVANDSGIWLVEIDCMTGEIKTARKQDEQSRFRWWMEMTLFSVVDEVEASWADDSHLYSNG